MARRRAKRLSLCSVSALLVGGCTTSDNQSSITTTLPARSTSIPPPARSDADTDRVSAHAAGAPPGLQRARSSSVLHGPKCTWAKRPVQGGPPSHRNSRHVEPQKESRSNFDGPRSARWRGSSSATFCPGSVLVDPRVQGQVTLSWGPAPCPRRIFASARTVSAPSNAARCTRAAPIASSRSRTFTDPPGHAAGGPTMRLAWLSSRGGTLRYISAQNAAA